MRSSSAVSGGFRLVEPVLSRLEQSISKRKLTFHRSHTFCVSTVSGEPRVREVSESFSALLRASASAFCYCSSKRDARLCGYMR